MTTRHSTSMMKSPMHKPMNSFTVLVVVVVLAFGFRAAQAQNAPESMRFFVTSVGSGKGGDLGGLAGADAPLPVACGRRWGTWTPCSLPPPQ